jgi:hypothetical protein
MAESKYEKYVIRHPMKLDPNRYPKSFAPPNRFLEGPKASQVPSETLVEYWWVTEDRKVGTELPRGGPQDHYFDELFCFIGTNPKDPDDLGGEVEFWMGMGAETEKIKLNTSSCIYVPGNVAHIPIFFRNVKRPFLVLTIGVGITVVNEMKTNRYGIEPLKGLL